MSQDQLTQLLTYQLNGHFLEIKSIQINKHEVVSADHHKFEVTLETSGPKKPVGGATNA